MGRTLGVPSRVAHRHHGGVVRTVLALALVGLALAASPAAAEQPAYLVEDINALVQNSAIGTQIWWQADVGGWTVIAARAEHYDCGYPPTVLWRSDGTAAGTAPFFTLAVDPYCPGCSNTNSFLGRLGGHLYFLQRIDGLGRSQLWRTDGTVAGTEALFEFQASIDSPKGAVMGGRLYFMGYEPASGGELWATDGTPGGTELVDDIYPGGGWAGFQSFTATATHVFFRSYDPLHGWEIRANDGTAGGTETFDICPGSCYYWYGSDIVAAGGKAYFKEYDPSGGGIELWVSDGTVAGTQVVEDICPGGCHSYPEWIRAVGSRVVFRAYDGTDYELWASDGTAAGTDQIVDACLGSCSGYADEIISDGTTAYYRAYDPTNGHELWRSDGTSGGTGLVADICPGGCSSSPQAFVMAGARVVFLASEGVNGLEPWGSDGTPAGTQLLDDTCAGACSLGGWSGSWGGEGSRALYRFYSASSGWEPWISDGTPAGSESLGDLSYTTASAFPDELVDFGGTLYFLADDGVAGSELWRSDGSSAGTALVADIHPAGGANGSELTPALGALFFSADDGVSGQELYRSDGSGPGTALVADIHPAGGASPQQLTAAAGWLFFTADDGTTGRELWASDGTGPGTGLVLDIAPAGDSDPAGLTAAGGLLFFSADDGTTGRELWVSDGTAGGTTLVLDIAPAGDSSPSELVAAFGGVLFSANDGASGRELWWSDGTAGGTALLEEIAAGPGGSNPTGFATLGDAVFFVADDGATGVELWRTDGTSGGTALVKNIRAGGSSLPQELTVVGGRLFFSADDGTHGRELWVSDGTAVGTQMVVDLAGGTSSANPTDFVAVGELVYFWSSWTGAHLLYRSDGSAAGTVPVPYQSNTACANQVSNPVLSGTRLFWAASGGLLGRELWAVELAQALAAIDFVSAESAVSEGAGTVDVEVVLTTADGQPLAGPVTVEYATANGGAVAGADYSSVGGTLVFPAGTASGATQTIAVPILDDAIAEASETFTVELAIGVPAIVGEPPGEAPAPPVSFVVGDAHTATIQDDDSGGILVSAVAPSPVVESGGAATFDVVLGSQPAADVTLALAAADSSVCTLAVGSLTFTTGNWATPQPVTLTLLDDAVVEPDKLCSVITQPAASGDPFYAGFDAPNPAVLVQDDDVASITVTPTAGLVTDESGASDQFSVVLTSQPAANVTVALASSDAGEATVPASVTFTAANWNVAQPVTVTGQPDAVDDGDVAYTILTSVASADPLYAVLNPADVAGSNLDDDAAGIALSQTLGLLTSESGGSDSFTVVLESEPTANVQVAIASTAPDEAAAVETSLLFTPGNWNLPQTVQVDGVDDPVIDGTQAFTVQVGPASSSDPLYAALADQFAGGDNADDDLAGIAVTPTTGLLVAESGTTAQFSVVLNTQPAADVAIAVASGDTAEVTVSGALLTFTSGDWNVPQTVTLTGVDDALVDGAQSVAIELGAAASADSNYSGLDPADVAVDNADDDAAAILVTPVAGLTTTEGLGTAQFAVVLTSQPAADVAIALAVDDGSEGELLSASTLTFTAGDWDQPQTVTVRGKNDDQADGDVAYVTELQGATSTDPDYAGLDPDDVNLTNLDDDSSGIVVSAATPATLGEPGSSATFTVALASQPTADVSLGLGTSDASECAPTVASVLLTPANWSSGVVVTVNAVDDLLADGTQACSVLTGSADSLDLAYDGVDPADVALSVTDNESAGVSVTPTSPSLTTEGGGTATFEVALTSQPAYAVVVNLTSTDLTEGTLSTTALTFSPANWNVPKSAAVFGQNDGAIDGDVLFAIETVVLSSDPVYAALDPADVALVNLDDETDLAISKDDGLSAVSAGETVTYTIVATNQGLAPVAGAMVSDLLPAILANVAWTCSASPGSSCAAGGTGDLAEPVTLASGGSATFTVSGDLPIDQPNGVLTNTASIAAPAGWFDLVAGNDADGDSTTIVEVPEPQVTELDTVRDTGDGGLAAGEATAASITQIYVAFSADMFDPPGDGDAEDVTNPANYRVFAAGPNGTLETGDCAPPAGDDVALALDGVGYDALAREARIRLAGATALAGAPHRLLACGTLAGENGLTLDGDGNGVGGDAFASDFVVTVTDRLANPNFDLDLTGWTVGEPVPGETQPGALDADGKPTSGSAEIQTAAGAGQQYELAQCFALGVAELVAAQVVVRIASTTPGEPVASVDIEYFDALACGGSSVGSAASPALAGDSAGVFVGLATGIVSPPELALSARLRLGIAGGTAASFTATWDNPFFGTPEPLFADGFESEDTSGWSSTQP